MRSFQEKMRCLLCDALSKIPIPANVYSFFSLISAIFGIMAFASYCIIGGVSWFSLSTFFSSLGWTKNHITPDPSKRSIFINLILNYITDSLFICSYIWVPIHIPFAPKSLFIVLGLFFISFPSYIAAVSSSLGLITSNRSTCIGAGYLFFIMITIPILSLYNIAWAGVVLMIFVGFGFIKTIKTYWATVKYKMKIRS